MCIPCVSLAVPLERHKKSSLSEICVRDLRRAVVEKFAKASRFLVKCQIVEPYVESGLLYGAVCPWEMASGWPVLEDFHDTLEAIWVWACYAKLSGDRSFDGRLSSAVRYAASNAPRFLVPENRSLYYDCSHVLLATIALERARGDERLRQAASKSARLLAKYLASLREMRGREYGDPWWMAACLSWYARHRGDSGLLDFTRRLVSEHLLQAKERFDRLEDEPAHVGPGGHDFFSSNANRALALVASLGTDAGRILEKELLPLLPSRFVERHADENAWNAHAASAMAAAYRITKRSEFLRAFDAIARELERRDRGEGSLPRSRGFPLGESWVAFFVCFAYLNLVADPAEI